MRRPALRAPEEVCRGARHVAALDIDGVLTSQGRDPLYRRALRASMGNVFLVPWAYLLEGDWVGFLRGQGFKTADMALWEDSLDIADPRLLEKERLAVVLGTEVGWAGPKDHSQLERP